MSSAALVEQVTIKPQRGPQEAFMSSPADIVFYGGAAFGGKTYALLMEPLRHCHNPDFTPILFRRNTQQIRLPGAAWDTSCGLYFGLGAVPRESTLEWLFPNSEGQPMQGCTLKMTHLENELSVHDHQGGQYCLQLWDELTHFTRYQFMYMLSRNRSLCDVKPYIRATCNPDPDSWVKEIIAWWLDTDTGLPLKNRSGVVRFFYVLNDQWHWYDTRTEAFAELKRVNPTAKTEHIKSFTFIAARISDNRIGNKRDPSYEGNLMAMPSWMRAQLYDGNWNARPAAGTVFKREWFRIVDIAPCVQERTRGWDLAATAPGPANPDPDYSAGVRLARSITGQLVVEHAFRMRDSAGQVRQTVQNFASTDPAMCGIDMWQDPGQAGKAQVTDYLNALVGVDARFHGTSKNLLAFAGPISAQAEQNGILLVRGDWNEPFIAELVNFSGDGKSHDDFVAALCCAYQRFARSCQVLDEQFMSAGSSTAMREFRTESEASGFVTQVAASIAEFGGADEFY